MLNNEEKKTLTTVLLLSLSNTSLKCGCGSNLKLVKVVDKKENILLLQVLEERGHNSFDGGDPNNPFFVTYDITSSKVTSSSFGKDSIEFIFK